MRPDPAPVVGSFRFEGRFVGAVPYGSGHINDSYALTFERAGEPVRYLLQRINLSIFRDAAALMSNIEGVTRHLRAKIMLAGGDPQRETLNLVPTTQDTTFHRDATGQCWRAYTFIEGALAYEMAPSLSHVHAAGKAFGNFLYLLADFPAENLHEVLPNFHNTPKRLEAFRATVLKDPVNRVAGVEEEIRFIEERASDTAVLVDEMAQGRLPLRVTHNDAKFSNVLIDNITGEGQCVIDLDTVMPGLSLYDFGDSVRAGAALAAEDEPDCTKAGLSLEIFEALTRGYLAGARDSLTRTELENLPFSARVITLEQAIRFLNDYLNGDIYYKINRPHHNLDRARTQISMLRDMEDKFAQMTAIVAECCDESLDCGRCTR